MKCRAGVEPVVLSTKTEQLLLVDRAGADEYIPYILGLQNIDLSVYSCIYTLLQPEASEDLHGN